MASSINASTSGAGGLISTADSSGVLNLQSGGTTVASIPNTTTFNFPALATRITGDFTNTTPSSRFAFQTSTANDATNLSVIPNGTSKYAGMTFFNSSDPNNASAFSVNTNVAGTAMNFSSYQTGTGTNLPIRFLTSSLIRASIATNGDFAFDSGYGSAATAYGCRAWVNFNGTGTVAIRASGNVTSITDNGTGDYTVNFTTAMPDVNYSITVSAARTSTNVESLIAGPTNVANTAVGSCRLTTTTDSGVKEDSALVCATVFR